MFADVLLETTAPQGRRRSLATLLSLSLQCSLLATLLIMPLIYTETLPNQHFLTLLVALRLRRPHPQRRQLPRAWYSAFKATS